MVHVYARRAGQCERKSEGAATDSQVTAAFFKLDSSFFQADLQPSHLMYTYNMMAAGAIDQKLLVTNNFCFTGGWEVTGKQLRIDCAEFRRNVSRENKWKLHFRCIGISWKISCAWNAARTALRGPSFPQNNIGFPWKLPTRT